MFPDSPRVSDPNIPLVAREIMQRMIRQFAAEYTSKNSSTQDSSQPNSTKNQSLLKASLCSANFSWLTKTHLWTLLSESLSQNLVNKVGLLPVSCVLWQSTPGILVITKRLQVCTVTYNVKWKSGRCRHGKRLAS